MGHRPHLFSHRPAQQVERRAELALDLHPRAARGAAHNAGQQQGRALTVKRFSRFSGGVRGVERSLIARLVDHADVGGDDFPPLWKPHPCLHLPPHPARRSVAIKKRRGDRRVAAIGRDHRFCSSAHQADGRAGRAERHDRVVAVEVFADAVAQRAVVRAEQFIEHGNVVRHQRHFIPLKLRAHFGEHFGNIYLHCYNPRGAGAETTPARSSAYATRSAVSSRQGAAMIWTPIGIGSSGTGTATTGNPMNEIGWVWMPMLARTGSSTPSSTNVVWPSLGATHGVAGAMITSTDLNSSSTCARYQRRNFCARSTSGAGIMAPASKRSRTAGSKSPGLWRKRSRCSDAPSLVVMT